MCFKNRWNMSLKRTVSDAGVVQIVKLAVSDAPYESSGSRVSAAASVAGVSKDASGDLTSQKTGA